MSAPTTPELVRAWEDALALHGPGTVAIVHQGTVAAELLTWVRTLPPAVSLVDVLGNEIARQRNAAVLAMLRRAEDQWLFFLDSDCVPKAWALVQLLAHGRDITAGVVLQRVHPFALVALEAADPPQRLALRQVKPRGVEMVQAAGMGAVLIRRRVLREMRRPWFRCGQIVADLQMEDLDFSLRASEQAGAPTWLAGDVRIGHRVQGTVVWPGADGKAWLEYGPGGDRVPALGAAVVEARPVAAGVPA